ncbi:hypothetical protein VOI54_08680 [Tamlana sp. 2201CG12-4]|uniref:hypothetical protein n=1 Tax=Tamlana sp. 2201CG12-4 TaxID=3112582 RepID=UPI002DB976B1|nr:hypothetical protein [Tamlana sp. 2201CG12-4]MEC3907093.1 hypothetical protein [Tamlana sp. 2201CG12-4]
MTNSTLLFRSLAIIIFIAGCAHLVSYTSKNKTAKSDISVETVNSETHFQKTEHPSQSQKEVINQKSHDIIGTWKVNYNTADFEGAIVYEIKKENKRFNAYTIAYQDKDGNSQKAENTKVLKITTFDGYKGKGIYITTFEGKQYNIPCEITFSDKNSFDLSYDYYGYSDIETWKKQ